MLDEAVLAVMALDDEWRTEQRMNVLVCVPEGASWVDRLWYAERELDRVMDADDLGRCRVTIEFLAA